MGYAFELRVVFQRRGQRYVTVGCHLDVGKMAIGSASFWKFENGFSKPLISFEFENIHFPVGGKYYLQQDEAIFSKYLVFN